MAHSAAIAIGVAKAGNLPALNGARDDARRFAQWARSNKYDVVTLIDDGARPVTLRAISDAVKAVIARDVERLLLFFSGHGASTASTDLWLLSDYHADSNEAVNLTASFNNAKRLPIGQIAVFADACRSSPPDLAGVLGGAIFPRAAASPETLPKWDHFLATRLGDIAQEAPGDGERLAYGVFSRCLFTALNGPPENLLEPRLLEPQTKPRRAKVLCSAKLADFLDEMVPLESGKIPGGRVQFPETSSGWRQPRDIYLELPLEPAREATGPRPDPSGEQSQQGQGGPHPGEQRAFRGTGAGPEAGAPGEAARERVRAARRSLESGLKNQEQAFALLGRDHFETERGLTIHGAPIVEVASAGQQAQLFGEAGLQHVRGRENAPQTVALRTAAGAWFPTVILPGFVGVVTLKDDAAISFNYQRIRGGLDSETEKAVRRWTALMTAGHAPRDEFERLAEWVRIGKHENPALGILAGYAYQRAGQLDGVDSIVGYFADRRQPVLYDLALLATYEVRRTDGRLSFPKGVRHGGRMLAADIAGTFPLMGQGWALLDRQDANVHPALPELKAGLLPSLWTMFRPAEGERLAALIRDGEL